MSFDISKLDSFKRGKDDPNKIIKTYPDYFFTAEKYADCFIVEFLHPRVKNDDEVSNLFNDNLDEYVAGSESFNISAAVEIEKILSKRNDVIFRVAYLSAFPEYKTKYNIGNNTTYIIFKNGEEVARFDDENMKVTEIIGAYFRFALNSD